MDDIDSQKPMPPAPRPAPAPASGPPRPRPGAPTDAVDGQAAPRPREASLERPTDRGFDPEPDQEPCGAGWSSRMGWSPGVAFMLALAVAGYTLVFLPERGRRLELEAEVAAARLRLAEIDERKRRVEERVAALAVGDPPAVEEAIRDQLRHGRADEFVVTDLYQPTDQR